MWRLGAVLALLRLVVSTRLWRARRYRHWRFETAFGRGVPESRSAQIRTALEFGRWVAMMRRAR